MRFRLTILALAALALSGCGNSTSSEPPHEQPRIYNAGEKLKIGNLIYSLVDTEILPKLGDDPATARTPENRFIVVHLTVFNSGNNEESIPGIMLTDDSGKSFNELSDGTGVQNFLGVIRKVSPNQTESGTILFDAPAQHYKVRLTDEFSPEVSIDMPLTFMHEQMEHIKNEMGNPESLNAPAPTPAKK